MDRIRTLTENEELDYAFIMDNLQDYASPRAKLTRLLRIGDLIRVKKGVYIFGQRYRRSPYSLEVLANKIYGPSYVSLEYALAYYGLIPEHVHEVTSVTSKRRAEFSTPIARFSYQKIPQRLFSVGFACIAMVNDRTALIATPEKAICDLLYLRNIELSTLEELESLLFEFYRLDETEVRRLQPERLKIIRSAGGSPVIDHLIHWLRRTS